MHASTRSFLLLLFVSLLPGLSCGGEETPQLGFAAGLEGQEAFEAVLDEFSLGFEEKLWIKQQAEYSKEGLVTGLTGLEEGQLAAILDSFALGRRLQLIERRQTNHLIVVSFVEWDSPAAALAWVTAQRFLMQAMDDQPGVMSAAYRDVATEDLSGFVAEKGLADFSGPYPSRSAVLARGKLVVEVTYLYQPMEYDALLDTARAFFDALGFATL